MDKLRPVVDRLDPPSVRCAGCGQVEDDAAQAQRWGYWSDRQGELYPYCPECAAREFLSGLGAGMDRSDRSLP